MPALRLAKRRAVRRRRQAGAAMFIVAMTLAVLASLGIYALAATQNEVRTSGNERQSTQTHYLAEYGILGLAHDLTGTKAQLVVGLMNNRTLTDVQASNPTQGNTCISLPGAPAGTPCHRFEMQDFAGGGFGGWVGPIVSSYGSAASPPPAYTPGVPPGSLGPVPMSGSFFVELTEPAPTRPPPGYQLSQSNQASYKFDEITASAYGVTQAVIPGNAAAQIGTEGLEAERARIVVGPILQQ
jgi:hypothetical protein